MKQLACHQPGGAILEPVSSIYQERKEDAFSEGPLSFEESLELIIRLTGMYTLITIIIDALDECDPTRVLDLLDAFKEIVSQSSSHVKVFISSRNHEDIAACLENWPNVQVQAKNNSKDIELFVYREVRLAIDSKKLLRGLVSSSLEQDITTTLLRGAQGM